MPDHARTPTDSMCADDGRGGADMANGSGLSGLADRVAALDGQFVVSSGANGGSVIRAEIPCA
jgi:signal transduction histidine kinase